MLVVLALLFGCLASAESPAPWKAGVATVSITPSEPVWMGGFSARKKPSEGIRQPLHAKALALQDATGKTAVLVTADIADFTREVSGQIFEHCRSRFGLTRDRLALNDSHTHSGPVIALSEMPLWYEFDEAQAEVVRRYTRGLVEKVVDVVGLAIKDLRPAALEFEQGLAGVAVNRRRVRQRSLPGPVDHDVPVLTVRSPAGELRAIVFGYACHATALDDYQISGDWPGHAQAEIEKVQPGAVALFVQGCGADLNPLPRRTPEQAQRHGQSIAEAVFQVVSKKMRPVGGPLKTEYELVSIPFHPVPTREELEKHTASTSSMERKAGQRLLRILDRDGRLPASYPYPIQVWQFGSGLKFIALGGEVVVDYSLRLKAQYGWDNTWVAGYSNDVFAYIPSLRVLKEGGYEGGDANIGDGHPGPFGGATEEIIVEKIQDLVERLKK